MTQKTEFTGIAEVGETHVGGKYDKRRKRDPWQKQAVMGIAEPVEEWKLSRSPH